MVRRFAGGRGQRGRQSLRAASGTLDEPGTRALRRRRPPESPPAWGQAHPAARLPASFEIGYARGTDEKGRYLIVPGDDAEFVREAFRRAAEGQFSMDEIRRRLVKQGFKCSKNQFTLMLRNPLYAGRIVILAWKGEPEEVVTGAHEPLVDEATFEKVQRHFTKQKRVHRKLVEELPLRGHLLDLGDGERLTGSRSRSRHGYYVWYYHGRGRGAYRINADNASLAVAEPGWQSNRHRRKITSFDSLHFVAAGCLLSRKDVIVSQ